MGSGVWGHVGRWMVWIDGRDVGQVVEMNYGDHEQGLLNREEWA